MLGKEEAFAFANGISKKALFVIGKTQHKNKKRQFACTILSLNKTRTLLGITRVLKVRDRQEMPVFFGQ